MANEATITNQLSIRVGKIEYLSQPVTFRADVAGEHGPTPGAVLIATTGTEIDLSQLTQPGLCRLQNLDDTNVVEVGIVDPQLSPSIFFPMIELLAGESYVVRLSRALKKEFGTGTGTGQLTGATNKLWARAYNQACVLLIEAFEV